MPHTTLKSFATARVRATVEWTDANPQMDSMPAGSSHYRVTLRYRRRQLTVPFSMGPAHCSEPTAYDVLDCLLSEASGADQSFDAWAADYGYDLDSRRAERTYRAVMRQTAGLRRLLGADFDAVLELER